MTFDDRLSAALGDHESTTEREAKRLAFYIFWNVKHEFTRRAALPPPHAATQSECVNPSVMCGAWLRRLTGLYCRNYIVPEDFDRFLPKEKAADAFKVQEPQCSL